MISIFELAVFVGGFLLQSQHALARAVPLGDPDRPKDLLVPVGLLPEGIDREAWFPKHGRNGWPMFSESCGENAELTAPYKPRRLLLWLYLRWPWQCELLHWLTTCKADVCDGIRFHGERTDPPFHVYAEWYGLTVRCDESLDHAGPRYSMGFGCAFERPGWYRCNGGADFEFRESNSCNAGQYANCFPCATAADHVARKAWIRTQDQSGHGTLVRMPP